MPKFYDELGEASLENLASDPSNLPEGRVWKNSTSQLPKVAIGGAVKELITNDATQTLSNKTISGASNTITNVSGSNVVNTPSGNLAATDVQAALNELQSDVDTRATSSALTTHTSATTSVHGITDTADLLTTSNAKVVTNKDIDGGTASNTNRVTIPKDTLANLQALTRKEGTIVYATDTDKFYSDNGTTLVPVGSGSGAKNYFTDGDSEGANPFTLFNDGVGVWVDGTGGSPTATITQSATTPLSGQKSFLFTSGSQYDTGKASVTIDREDKYKVITLDVSYEKVSGTFADGDLQVFVFDSTNSAILYAMPISDIRASGVNAKQQFSFQATDSLTYEILVHQKTSATFSIKFEMKFGPQQFAGYAPITTDLKSWTPTFTGVTASNVDMKWCQRGESLYLVGKFDHTGGTGITFTLPNGYKVDSSKISTSNYHTVGMGSLSSAHYTLTVLAQGDSQTLAFGLIGSGIGGNVVFTAWSSETMQFFAEVPVLGWSSESKVISEYDGRVVAASYKTAAGQNTSSIIDFDSKVFDTHGAVTTGASWKFTAPVSGKYQINNTLRSNAGVEIHLFKNGSLFTKLNDTQTNIVIGSSYTIDLVKGDYIHLIGSASSTLTSDDGHNHIEIFLLSGAQQILAGQKILAKYKLGSNLAVAANDPIIFDTKIIDDTGAYNTTTGVWTAQANGRVRITFSGNASAITAVYYKKNGTTKHHVASIPNNSVVGSGYTIEPVVEGDEITINSYDAVTYNAQMVSIDATTVLFEMI